MPIAKFRIDCIWSGMDYLTSCLKENDSALPQLRTLFMLEGWNAGNNELKKANKL